MPVDVMNCLVPPEMSGKRHMIGNVIIPTQITTMIAVSDDENNRKRIMIYQTTLCHEEV